MGMRELRGGGEGKKGDQGKRGEAIHATCMSAP